MTFSILVFGLCGCGFAPKIDCLNLNTSNKTCCEYLGVNDQCHGYVPTPWRIWDEELCGNLHGSQIDFTTPLQPPLMQNVLPLGTIELPPIESDEAENVDAESAEAEFSQ